MSILIKGVSLPPDDRMVFVLYIRHDGMVRNPWGTEIGKAIELPPNGRLVDADALITVMEKCADALKPCTEKLCYNFAAAILREASPIIPADPEGGVDG